MFAVLRLPQFPLQAVLRHEPERWQQAVALMDQVGSSARVLHITELAEAARVQPGLTAPQAAARCPQVLIKSRSTAQEKIARDILLQVAHGFAPRIEETSEGVCTVDLRELNLARPENWQRMLARTEQLIADLAQFGLRVHAGLASTPTLAWHAAYQARPLLRVENAAEFMAALPIESLGPSPSVFDLLQRWGIHRVGEFTALGKDNLAERLGMEGLELLERASLDLIRPLALRSAPENFTETLDFEQEIDSLPPLLFVLNRFVEQLVRRMTLCHFAVAELRLRLILSSQESYQTNLRIPSPTGKKDVLLRMLQTHLETVRTEAAIVGIELLAWPSPIQVQQLGLFEAGLRDPNQFSQTLAQLSALCGSDRIGSPVLQDSHRPDAFRMVAPNFSSPPTQASNENRSSFGLRLRRFRPALPAQVQIEAGLPKAIEAPRLRTRIEEAAGPWLNSGQWWEAQNSWNRAEWDVRGLDGGLYRIYCEDEHWFLEGIYD